VTTNVKIRADQKRRLSAAARQSGHRLSAFVLSSGLTREQLNVPEATKRGRRPDYHAEAVSAHGGRYLAVRLVESLER
jgi:hypothetical protein